MARFTIGNFARAGEYLVMENGTVIARSKSYHMVKRIALALADDEGADADVNPEIVSDAAYYEGDEIPFWPRLRFDTEPHGFDPNGTRTVIRTRVAELVLNSSYDWHLKLSEEDRQVVQAQAIRHIDTRARRAWGLGEYLSVTKLAVLK